MEIILYRHAQPEVSDEEVIYGNDYPKWVRRYEESDIVPSQSKFRKEKLVLTSTRKRSWRTGEFLAHEVIQSNLLREAEVPLIRFPRLRLKAKYWIFLSRILWLLGISKDCESRTEAQQRVCQLLEVLVGYLNDYHRVVIVGHGFLNGMLKKKLLKKDWVLTENQGHKFLDRMVFKA